MQREKDPAQVTEGKKSRKEEKPDKERRKGSRRGKE
jgi:hypothetical protein